MTVNFMNALVLWLFVAAIAAFVVLIGVGVGHVILHFVRKYKEERQ